MTEGPRTSRAGALEYVPALDGLRAICVIAVLCFHAGFDEMRGGFLGVSTFFTLSGYLVTTILFAGLERSSEDGGAAPRVALAEFWRRRLRRLVPASIVTLVAVVAIAPAMLGPEAQARLGADVLASLLYVVNWRFLQGEYAYALIFSSPSMLQHYWSLAIEGQLYVVLPLLLWVAARTSEPRRAYAAMVGVLLAVGVLVAFFFGADPQLHDRVYYGTDTRAPELLVGALLALGLRVRVHGPGTGGSSRSAETLAWLALGAVLLAFSRVPLASDFLHRGGFAAFAALSALLIAACARGLSVGRVLALGPLVWIGRVSYGVYLLHWPIYLALDHWLGDPPPIVKLALGGGLTLALAGASHAFVETPIRRGRGWVGHAPILASGAAIVGVAAFVALQLPVAGIVDELRGDAGGEIAVEAAELEEATHEEAAIEGAAPANLASILLAPRLAVFGDSVALSFSRAMKPWFSDHPEVRRMRGWSPLGCGLLMPDFVLRRVAAGERVGRWMRLRADMLSTREDCLRANEEIRERLRIAAPDLAISMSSPWDLLGVPDDVTFEPRRIGDPSTDERLRQTMDRRVALLASEGAMVAWTNLPVFRPSDRYPMSMAEIEAARSHYNALVEELARRHPETVVVVDLADWVERWPNGPLDPALREDGLHFTKQGVTDLLAMGLGDELVELTLQARQRREDAAAR